MFGRPKTVDQIIAPLARIQTQLEILAEERERFI